MDILVVDAAGEQWHTEAAPTCWCSAEVGWTASSCAPHQYMPTHAAVCKSSIADGLQRPLYLRIISVQMGTETVLFNQLASSVVLQI